MPKKIIISVTSDLVYDQRVHKVSQTLHEAGFEVTLVGRQKKTSSKILIRDYETYRFKLIFESGFLFYITFQIRLFLYLLFKKSDIILSNDLDTLLPNYFISRIKRKKIIYDTHEYFTGVPELLERKFVRNVWKKIENYIFPKLPLVYTVNESIAKLYANEFGNEIKIVRNLPFLNTNTKDIDNINYLSHYQEIIKIKTPIILYQGAVNKDRGLEEMIDAMQQIEAKLVIIGDGDVFSSLKILAEKVKNKVYFTGYIPFEILPNFTKLATLGISLEKPTNINYKFASPNKVVDYMQSDVPILATNLIEIDKIITQYEIGKSLNWKNSNDIALAINDIIFDTHKLEFWKKNCQKAKKDLCWENEKQKLISLFESI